MTTLFDSAQWSTSPVAYWTIQYEYQRSGVNMQYRFYWKVWLKNSTSWYNDGLQLRLFLNGVQNNITVKAYNSTVSGWSYEGTTGWYTVSNKTSGTTPFYASLYDTNTYETKSTSETYSLAVSPCQATMTSAPDFNDESNPTIYYTNLAANNVSSLQACISLTGDIADIVYRDVPKTGTSYTFNLTEAERNVLRNATKTSNSRTVMFCLRTIIDGHTFYSNITKTLSIINANPLFTASQVSYADTNSTVVAITGNNQHIVQNKSSLQVTFESATGKKGASISGYTLTVNGATKTATASGNVSFGAINSGSNVTLSISAKDSRGNVTTVEKTITILPYATPIVTAVLERVNNYENTTYFTPNVSIASVNGKNTVAITYKYKQSGGSYGSSTTVINNTEYTLNFDNRYAYIFSITATDKFETVTKELVLSKGRFPLFIDTELNAVGVNEFPSNGEALRVAGGVACFDDGIVLKTATKSFKITINDSGTLVITQIY